MKKEDYLVQEIARLNLLVAEVVESHDKTSKENEELRKENEELRKSLSRQEVKDDVQTKK